ncbi:MAG TPA: hypothetical protein VG940_08260 [Gemmatimonadales bacterium]|nr:hypothetical protein [Gemmatimonadales bacterium]
MNRIGVGLLGALMLGAPAPQRLSAQWPDPRVAAAEIARAWQGHDFGTLVGGARVEIRLPGISASGPVPPEQARVLLAGYVRGAEEVSVEVMSVMEVSQVSGYAELRRRYRPRGVGEPAEETILVGLVRTRLREGAGEGAFGPWRVEVVQAGGPRGR